MRILKYHAGVVCAAIAAAVIGLTSCRPAGSPNSHSANSSSTQPTPSTPPPVLARHPQLQEGSAKFAVRLLQQVLEERPNDNFCVSPLDVQSGLSLLLSGLHAQGYQEVADALGYGELPLDAVNAFQRTVWEQVHAEGDAYEVRQALALYTVAPYRWTAAVKQAGSRQVSSGVLRAGVREPPTANRSGAVVAARADQDSRGAVA